MYVCHLPPTHPATCSAQKSAAASSSCILRCMLRRQLEVRSDGVELSAHQLQLLVVLADELKGRRGEAGCRSWGERRGADVGAWRGSKACGRWRRPTNLDNVRQFLEGVVLLLDERLLLEQDELGHRERAVPLRVVPATEAAG